MPLEEPEAHIMDINTVGLWLTNAKHQPTDSVEIEGQPATRQASITEFFTSVATSAAFQVVGDLAKNGFTTVTDGVEYLSGLTEQQLNAIAINYGTSSFTYQAANAFYQTKEFVTGVVEPITNAVESAGDNITSTFKSGFDATKAAFTNPISSKYTQWIADTYTNAADYLSKASSLAGYSAQQLALQSASQYTSSTSLPTFKSAADHSNNLVKGNFTVEDAANRAKPQTVTLLQEDGTPLKLTVSNDVLRILGYKEQPTFEQMAGILSKDHLHDDLEAALADELLKRNADLTVTANFTEWQNSFSHLQSCIQAVREETISNNYYIQLSIAQENTLSGLLRVHNARQTITDPVALATYEKCITTSSVAASDALTTLIELNNQTA